MSPTAPPGRQTLAVDSSSDFVTREGGVVVRCLLGRVVVPLFVDGSLPNGHLVLVRRRFYEVCNGVVFGAGIERVR